jgi:hypothetical protein
MLLELPRLTEKLWAELLQRLDLRYSNLEIRRSWQG